MGMFTREGLLMTSTMGSVSIVRILDPIMKVAGSMGKLRDKELALMLSETNTLEIFIMTCVMVRENRNTQTVSDMKELSNQILSMDMASITISMGMSMKVNGRKTNARERANKFTQMAASLKELGPKTKRMVLEC